mgnify:CR=1 FL=1
MPELPEAEVVRRGMEPYVAGAVAGRLHVCDVRALRRCSDGPAALAELLDGAVLARPQRRGKFLWVPLQSPRGRAVVVHLGMSGQIRVDDPGREHQRHLRLRLPVRGADGVLRELRFVDQRLFGGWWDDELTPCPVTGEPIPATAAHIALDPLHPGFDSRAVAAGWRSRRTAVKRALLDQTVVSGIGNIYADEALWAARVHPEQSLQRLSVARGTAVLDAAADVMRRALAVGGTSFDALYVNVEGRTGYFARSLNAYGRTGEPCPRCLRSGRDGRIRRVAFMNRASHLCPVCQRRR